VAIPLSNQPERVKRVFINDMPLEVERVWWHGDRLVFKFNGIDTISAAEALAGADVCIPIEERLRLPEGEYYLSDLIGCDLYERQTGRLVGRVKDIQEYGGPALLEVRDSSGAETLVPFVPAICVKTDVAAKRIDADLPEGLGDLNKGA
jgi:16S rRNA processing protein RimM